MIRAIACIVVPSIAVGGAWMMFGELLEPAREPAFVALLATISVTLAGFAATTLAILASLGQARLLKNMTKTGHTIRLHQILFASAGLYFIALVAAIVAHVVNGIFLTVSVALGLAFLTAGSIAFLYGGCAFYNVVSVLYKKS